MLKIIRNALKFLHIHTEEDREAYKLYIDEQYLEAKNSDLMKGVRLVLTENGAYKIRGKVSCQEKPISPSFVELLNTTHYNELNAKEDYVSIYRKKLYEEKDKKYVEVE